MRLILSPPGISPLKASSPYRGVSHHALIKVIFAIGLKNLMSQ